MTSTKPILTEKQFQAQIVELAKLRGWMTYHTRDSRGSEKGYPDLCLSRPPKGLERRGRLLFCELKSSTGVLRKDQKTWLSALATCGDSVEVFVWKPSDWPEIERTLA